MGVCVSYELIDVVVPADQVADALAVVRKHVEEHRLGADRDDLCEALDQARFRGEQAANGDVVIEEFTGEKLWDEGELFDELAPLVKEGGVIYAEAEGDYWKLVFKGGAVHEYEGRMVYEDEAPAEERAS